MEVWREDGSLRRRVEKRRRRRSLRERVSEMKAAVCSRISDDDVAVVVMGC